MSRVALVTGGQQGIGLGVAEALAGAGFLVAIASERDPDAPEVTNALARLGGRGSYYHHDVRSIEGAAGLVARVEDQMGPITTYVSNAGVPAKVRGDMLDLAPDSFDFVLAVNLRGAFFLAQAVARHMVDTESDAYRSMIFITSVSAEVASIERAEYCISKAGAAMMARLFALRLAPHGIGTFELRPGIIETAMTAGVKEKYSDAIADGLVPARRWGHPDDIGAAALALALGHMEFATGAVIPIDGGLSLPRL